MYDTEIARICHEANRALCEVNHDTSQKPWEQAEQWQRDSAVQGVIYARTHPACDYGDLHRAWVDAKVAEGWTYGPEKDPVNKKHPCLVPYEDLPSWQREKDRLFLSICRTLSTPVEAPTC